MSADDNPDPQRLLKLARQTMSSAERRRKFRRIDFMDANWFYPTQLKFLAAGGTGIAPTAFVWGQPDRQNDLRCCRSCMASHRQLPGLVRWLQVQQANSRLGSRVNRPHWSAIRSSGNYAGHATILAPARSH